MRPTTKRLIKFLERSPTARVLSAISALLGAAVLIGGVSKGAYDWYDKRFRWENRVETKLESLRANVRLDDFDRRLGLARITTPSESGKFTQHIYQGRGYWVQAVADQNKTVSLFAVTVCSHRVNPGWKVWNSRDSYEEVQINRTRVSNTFSLAPVGYNWFFSGATANTFVYAIYGGGNPTNYQHYAWGYNDACQDDALSALNKEDTAVLMEHFASGPYEDTAATPELAKHLSPDLDRIFRRIRVNTFAVFGVHQDPGELTREVQIGANRILTRTLENP